MDGLIICPVCRSTLRAVGYIDFKAPAISVIKCPVCGTPIDVPSVLGSGLLDTLHPMRWDGFDVVNRVEPVNSWADLQKQNPQATQNLEKPIKEEFNQPVLSTLSLTQPFVDIANAVKTPLAITGVVMVAVALIIVILAIKLK